MPSGGAAPAAASYRSSSLGDRMPTRASIVLDQPLTLDLAELDGARAVGWRGQPGTRPEPGPPSRRHVRAGAAGRCRAAGPFRGVRHAGALFAADAQLGVDRAL